MNSEERFFIPRLVLIGVGLIGGSLVQALRNKNALGEVVGIGRSIANLEAAQSLGVIDHHTSDYKTALKGATMVIIATPVGAFGAVLNNIMPHLEADTIVTDVGSVKGEIVSTARRIMGDRLNQFVPAHPIAGSEKSGVNAAFPELFINHKVIFTPLVETSNKARQTVQAMWALTGASLVDMSVDLHDQVLGVTSHLPHILAYGMIDYLSQQDNQSEHSQFAAGGLFDSTRIASSDAVMWRDICMNNKDKLVPIVRGYSESLNSMADQIEAGDAQGIEQIFVRAKALRAVLARARENR